MNIKQAISTNFTGMFHDMTEEERAEQIKAIRYLQHLSNASNISLDSVDLLEFSSSRGRIYTAKPKLNELFFHFSQKQLIVVPDKKEIANELAKSLVDDVTNFVLRQRKNSIAQHKSNMTYYLQEIQNLYRSAENKSSRYLLEYQKLLALEGSEEVANADNINSAVAGIFNQTDFIYLGRGGSEDYPYENWHKFSTARDVVMKYLNPVAKIDMTVNLGKYRIWINFSTGKVRIHELEGNLNTNGPNGGGYYHPFIASNGEVCWGNYKDRILEMFVKLQYADILRATAGLLTQYSSDVTPYCQLRQFNELQKIADMDCKCGAKKRYCKCPVCSYCGKKGCNCWTCPRCGKVSRSSKPMDKRCSCCLICDGDLNKCKCCQVCESEDYKSCGCCTDCNSTKENCECGR